MARTYDDDAPGGDGPAKPPKGVRRGGDAEREALLAKLAELGELGGYVSRNLPADKADDLDAFLAELDRLIAIAGEEHRGEIQQVAVDAIAAAKRGPDAIRKQEAKWASEMRCATCNRLPVVCESANGRAKWYVCEHVLEALERITSKGTGAAVGFGEIEIGQLP